MKKYFSFAHIGILFVCLCFILFTAGVQPITGVSAAPLPEQPAVPDAGPPTLLEPQKNVVMSDHTPMFRWEEELMADHYTLEIKDRVTNAVIAKATYTASVRCSGGVCSVPSPVSLPNDEYKWHVLSRQDGQRMGWSKWWNLTIGSISLATPTQTFPADNDIDYRSQPFLNWTHSTGAIEYRVRVKNQAGVFVYDDTVGNGICYGTCSGNCELILPIDLSSYETYRWQVQARNGEYYSTWTTFDRIRYTRVPMTTLVSPGDGWAMWSADVMFQWEPVEGATRYQITIRRESNGDLIYNELIFPPPCSVSMCTWTYDGPPLAFATYQWHVRGTNDSNRAQWTPYWVFHQAGH